VPGKTYHLQFKDRLDNAPWTGLGEAVVATGPAASQVDATAKAAKERYYRVLLAE
jgi:hypothetical protein